MEKRNRTTTLLVMTALMTAVTTLCTVLLKIPVDAECYLHLGDAVLFLCVMMLPRKYACFAAPVGAMLADLMGGLAFWMPWTFCIKLIMVLVSGAFIDMAKKSCDSSQLTGDSSQPKNSSAPRRIAGVPVAEFIGLLLASLLGTAGYFFAERILFGNWISAATCVPFNLIQTCLGSIIAVIVSNSLSKSTMKEFMYYRRG